MSLRSDLESLGQKVTLSRELIKSEEHTKMAFIVPFIQALGFDIFNPLEVVPEYTCDFGIKKGEKIDYCIMLDSSPYILIECKDCRNALSKNNVAQLYRYFSVSSAKLAILTNGVEYMLFTDALEKNKMDSDPFYTFKITSISDADYDIITGLQKERLKSMGKGFYTSLMAKRQLFTTELSSWISAQVSGLSKGFVNFLKKEINTYELPNEEIEKVVRKQLFGYDAQEDLGKGVEEEQVVTKGVQLSSSDEKRKRTALGQTGEFSITDAAQAITGGVLSYVVIDGTKYSDLQGTYQLYECIIDYALDKLKLFEKQLIDLDDDSGNYFTTQKKAEEESQRCPSKRFKEYRGIYYNSTMSGAYCIRTGANILQMLGVPLEKVKVGILSKNDATVLISSSELAETPPAQRSVEYKKAIKTANETQRRLEKIEDIKKQLRKR